MKGKLIKTDVNYILEDDNGVVIASTSLKKGGLSLSLRNCQSIELNCNLDELAGEFAKTKSSHPTFQNTHKRDFIEGFQKALELMGDKKYTEKDIDKAYWAGMQFVGEDKGSFGEFIQSLQQTEWDVEIEIGICGDKVYIVPEPVLDEDGCLILKRI